MHLTWKSTGKFWRKIPVERDLPPWEIPQNKGGFTGEGFTLAIPDPAYGGSPHENFRCSCSRVSKFKLLTSMLRSLVKASVAASRRAVAWNFNDIAPPAEQLLFRFAAASDLSPWEVYADDEHGGLSKASLELNKESGQTGVFAGTLSVDIHDNANIRMKRSGFTGMRTSHEDDILDLEPFDTIAFRLKGDGRVYVSNIRTENWIGGLGASPSNTWQAFVFAPAGEWSVVRIPLSKYLPTWRGKIIDTNQALNAARVTGMGLSLTADGGPEKAVQGPGQFRLELDWIKALRGE